MTGDPVFDGGVGGAVMIILRELLVFVWRRFGWGDR